MGDEQFTILLVEDDQSHAELIRRSFQRHSLNMHLEITCNLKESRLLLNRFSPDLIIADYALPDGKGVELLQNGGKDSPYPLIIITNQGSERIAVDVMKAGAINYFIKSENTFAQIPRFAEYAIYEWRQINSTRQDLKKAYEELEETIRQRTLQLEQANEQLQEEIIQHKRTESILAESEKLAATGRMAARIAHEINNPLAGIKNSFRLVKDAIPKDHIYYDYVTRIEKEIKRIAGIVRQMFDLYRPEKEPPRKFEVSDLINDVVSLLKFSAEEHNVNIEFEIKPGTDTIIITETMFKQVMFNVIQNAIDASPSGKAVKISAEIDNHKLIIMILDEGLGIKDNIRDSVFGPFFTTKTGRQNSGLGVGLSVCKSIIDAMNGSICFESKLNIGTVFTITIPVKDDTSENHNE